MILAITPIVSPATMLYLIMIVITTHHKQSAVLETPYFIITAKTEEPYQSEYFMILAGISAEQPLVVAEYSMILAQTLEALVVAESLQRI